jgi:hypothetical protein
MWLGRGPRVLAISLLFVANACVGCNDCDRGLDLRIQNHTAEALTITIEEPGRLTELGTIEPGDIMESPDLFRERPMCLGPFVARSASGREVARAVQVCPNVDWNIDEVKPRGSPAP